MKLKGIYTGTVYDLDELVGKRTNPNVLSTQLIRIPADEVNTVYYNLLACDETLRYPGADAAEKLKLVVGAEDLAQALFASSNDPRLWLANLLDEPGEGSETLWELLVLHDGRGQ